MRIGGSVVGRTEDRERLYSGTHLGYARADTNINIKSNNDADAYEEAAATSLFKPHMNACSI